MRDAARAGQPDRVADLAHARGIAATFHVVADDLEDAALARCKPVVVGRTVGKRMELGHDRLRWPAGLAPLASLAGSAFVRHGCPLSVVIDLVGTVALTGDSFKQLFECFAVLSAGGCRKSLRRSIEPLFEPLDSLWRRRGRHG
jgi:hypothetical protein